MMKKIMNVRVAAVALAASALIAAPAMADPARGSIAQLETRLGATGLSIQIGHKAPTGRHGRYRANQWGQSLRQERQLRRNAVQACRAAISRTAWRAGFHDVDFDDDRRIQQIGPNGFRIRFDDVEFENRRRERERDVTCLVRRGQVARLDGIPQTGQARNRGQNGHSRYGY